MNTNWKALRKRKKARRRWQRARRPRRARLPDGTIAIGIFKGPPCPRCEKPTQVREHRNITAKLLRQPFFYLRWYCCMNTNCRTTIIMPPEFRVFRDDGIGLTPRKANLGDATQEQGGAVPTDAESFDDVALAVLDQMRDGAP